MDHPHIVKRRGHKEPYDNHKVYASCYAACLNAHISKERAESICSGVMGEMDLWMSGKDEVYSQQIFDEATRIMEKFDKEASFMYKSHRDIS